LTFTWDFLNQQHTACCYISKFVYMRFPWSTTHFTWDFLGEWHMAFPILFRNLFTWDFLGEWHMAFPILFRNLTFTWDSLDNDVWHAITFPILFINLTFTWDSLWLRTYGVLLQFLCCSEIWHLHEIFLVKMQSCFLNFDIYMRFTVIFQCEKVYNMQKMRYIWWIQTNGKGPKRSLPAKNSAHLIHYIIIYMHLWLIST